MFTGATAVAIAIGSVIGPVLGGALTENLSWRWCFYINLPIGAAVTLMILVSLEVPKDSSRARLTWTEVISEFDPLGVVFLLFATLCLLLVLQIGGIQQSWTSAMAIGCIIGSVLLFTAFIIDQHIMNERAVYPLRMLKNRDVLVGACWSFLCSHSNQFC